MRAVGQIATIVTALLLAAGPGRANLVAVPDTPPPTYLREIVLPVDDRLRLVEADRGLGAAILLAQAGPDTSFVPLPRAVPEADLDAAARTPRADIALTPEESAALLPTPRPEPLQGAVTVVAAADGSILRPRPRDSATIAAILDGTTGGLTATPLSRQIALSPVTPDTLRPRPRPAAVEARANAAVVLDTSDAGPPPLPDPGPDTPQTVSAPAAVGPVALNDISLVGVFGTTNSRRALLRMADGSVQRVSRGSDVDGWRILAVDPRAVRMIRDSEVRLLELP